ncbi:MAG TPA: hypothetical protein DCL38_00085 [Lachnospiraceae bacterium]|nr:hypothetical protein [Lachnospiraceae bacterium]
MIRSVYVLVFAFMIALLALCAILARRSEKPIGRFVSLLCLSLIPPVLGNMIIIGAQRRIPALIGCYCYYIGMDLIMIALTGFTSEYCKPNSSSKENGWKAPVWVYALLVLDIIQLTMNPFFGHAFTLQEIEVYGLPYFQMVPLGGQTYHRIVCYGTLLMIMFIFLIMCIKMPGIYREQYAVILFSMLAGAIWQTFYIFSRTPIDRSMAGFVIFGLLIFYFTIYYRPLRLLDRMLANIVSSTTEAIFLYAPDGICIWANEPGIELTGIESGEYEKAGKRLEEFFGSKDELPEQSNNELIRKSGDETWYYVLDHGSFYDEKGRKLGSYIYVRDITEERLMLEREVYAANHDALTGLYTREFLLQRISGRLKRNELSEHYIALIDVSEFKIVNDIYGKEFGDYALTSVADWIRSYSDASCIYGRLSGDTFGSCIPKKLFIPEVLEKDLSDFKIKKGSTEHHLVIHIGFCDISPEDKDASILFDRARLALDSIRNDYKTHIAFYDSAIREKVRRNQEISSELSAAISENQLIPYLQPIVDRSGRIVGAEALARWIHPDRGFMPPNEFIPLFEENGMIVDVDKHIWRCACRILSGWRKSHPDLFLSINVSPKDFYLTDVLSDILALIREYDLDPANLRIEVTETSMMSDTDDRMKILEEFRQNGFIVEMDDFGSGYSSLNMLKDMPVDVLKIDMKFLSESKENSRANTIVKNIIKLSRDLGIHPLTEGVETREQFDILLDMGCMLFQGFYFAKPLIQEEFEKRLTGAQA